MELIVDSLEQRISYKISIGEGAHIYSRKINVDKGAAVDADGKLTLEIRGKGRNEELVNFSPDIVTQVINARSGKHAAALTKARRRLVDVVDKGRRIRRLGAANQHVGVQRQIDQLRRLGHECRRKPRRERVHGKIAEVLARNDRAGHLVDHREVK